MTSAMPPRPASGNGALVRFVGVRKTYDGVTPVVEALDLDIVHGEFLTLLGPSGSGKTTTLMMLAGFEAPTAGDILLEGRSIRRLPPHRREIGMVFQHYALFPHMTVAENLAFGLPPGVGGRHARRARIDAALSEAGLAGFGDRDPATLSGGQRARVALLRCLLSEPRALLLDEPFGRLDLRLRDRFRRSVLDHARDQLLPTLLVTHDPADAAAAGGPVIEITVGAQPGLDSHATAVQPAAMPLHRRP